jgi:hypothetical protein
MAARLTVVMAPQMMMVDGRTIKEHLLLCIVNEEQIKNVMAN